MKILITTDWYKPTINGVVTSVINLSSELEKAGHEVKIITLANSYRSYRQGNVYYLGSISVEKFYPEARMRLPIQNELVEQIVEWEPEVIHSQCEFSTFLIARRISRRLNIPIVHTYHTVYEDYTHYFSPSQKMARKIVSTFSKNILSHTSQVIVPTVKVKALLEGYDVQQPISVIPTGINLGAYGYKLSPQKKQSMRSQWGIPKENKIILYLGRIAKEKNLEEIVEYLKKIRPEKTTLLIVGDGPYKKELEDYITAQRLEIQVIFTGMVSPDSVADFYKLSSVFVSASNSETQGLTYIESLASGTPAICKADPCLEGVIIDGVNGWQYTSFEQFSEKLTLILGDEGLRNKLSKQASERAVADFSTVTFAGRVEEVYRKAVMPVDRKKTA